MSDLPMSQATGIFQGDVIVRKAIEEGLKELRDNPQLLDYIWSSLVQDEAIRAEYGEGQIEEAKNWFLATDIPVVMNLRVPDNFREGAFITISVQKGDNSSYTLGDSHFAFENVDNDRPFLTGTFVPLSFNRTVGEMKVPSSVYSLASVGARVVTRDGQEFPITAKQDGDVLVIANSGKRPDFLGARIRSAPGSFALLLEGNIDRETYGIGCHSYSEPITALVLGNLVYFALSRGKEKLLEGRGLQGTTLSLGPLDVSEAFGAEAGYSRFLTLTGMVHQVWVKGPKANITATEFVMTVTTASGQVRQVSLSNADDELWLANQDPVGLSFS